jgi:hypothetical protein
MPGRWPINSTLGAVPMASNTQIREALEHAREIVIRCKVLADKQLLWIQKCDKSLQEIDAVLATLDTEPKRRG